MDGWKTARKEGRKEGIPDHSSKTERSEGRTPNFATKYSLETWKALEDIYQIYVRPLEEKNRITFLCTVWNRVSPTLKIQQMFVANVDDLFTIFKENRQMFAIFVAIRAET